MSDNGYDGTIFTRKFWKETAERAIKTFGQSWGGILFLGWTNLIDVGWVQSLGAAGFTTLLSVLTSIGTAAAKNKPTADATK